MDYNVNYSCPHYFSFIRQAEHYCDELALCLISQDGCLVVPFGSWAGPQWKYSDQLLKNEMGTYNQYCRN
jgi:hypothetical protein